MYFQVIIDFTHITEDVADFVVMGIHYHICNFRYKNDAKRHLKRRKRNR